jgi:hypothetical protein
MPRLVVRDLSVAAFTTWTTVALVEVLAVYSDSMSEDRVWTAAELERLTPDQRAAVVRGRVVTDLDELDPELVERARAYGRRLLEAKGAVEPST